MTFPPLANPIVKVAIVLVCLLAVAVMKYKFKWSDNNALEVVAETVIKDEIGVEIPLPDLPTPTTPTTSTTPTTTTTPASSSSADKSNPS